MMEYSEQFMEHIEYTFAAFCNVVLRNAAINAYRDFGRKQKHSQLPEIGGIEAVKKRIGENET